MRSLLLVLLLLMTACNSLNPVGVAKGLLTDDKGLEVETELVIGDKAVSQEVQLGSRDSSSQQAQVINNSIKNKNIDPMLLMLLIIGWLAPSPVEIWHGFLRLLPWVDKKK